MKNNGTKLNWMIVVVLLLFWGICASFYPSLPEQVPTHWNFKGEVDGYSHKAVAAFILPLLPLAIYLLMTFLPKIDPKRENYQKFGTSYEIIKMSVVILMAGTSLISILAGKGYNINVTLIMRIAMPMLFIVLGNFMGKIRFNYFTGIRVPWTLASETVWNKTHRFAGKAMVIGGLIALLGVFAPPIIGMIILFSGIFVPMIISIIYSYFAYKNTTSEK